VAPAPVILPYPKSLIDRDDGTLGAIHPDRDFLKSQLGRTKQMFDSVDLLDRKTPPLCSAHSVLYSPGLMLVVSRNVNNRSRVVMALRDHRNSVQRAEVRVVDLQVNNP
jgi:hypothetical protein